MLTKEEATKKGKALLKRMKTKGWKLRVWENLGWHYSLQNPPLCVSPSVSGMVFTLMTEKADEAGWGSLLWDGAPHSRSPNKAVADQVKLARKVVNDLNKVVEAAEKIVRSG